MASLNEEHFDQIVSQKLQFIGLGSQLDAFKSQNLTTNVAFFQFLIEQIQEQFEKKGEALDDSVQEKISKYDSLAQMNSNL